MNRPSRLFTAARGYRSLEVWRLGMDAAESIYSVTSQFPREERYALTDQLRRAAVSVPSNLAEGNERRTERDQLRFVTSARGSLAEIETQLELAYRFSYVGEPELAPTIELLDHLGRKLHRFSDSLSRRLDV